MSMLKIVATIVLGYLFACSSAVAQQQTVRYGVYGGYGFNVHSASFSELPGVPSCCPRFESGNGSGMSFGALLNIPLTSRLLFDLRAGMNQQSGVLSAQEATGVIVGGVAKSGAFEHTIDADLSVVVVEPSVALRVVGGLSVRAGMSAGILLKKQYSQKEQIVQPERSATFVDENGVDTRSRTRNESSGELPGASQFQAAIVAGVGYDVPLTANRSLLAAPEITYTLPLTSVLADESWRVQTVRFGVALKYGSAEEVPLPEIPRVPPRVDTLRVPVVSLDSVRFALGTPFEYVETVSQKGRKPVQRSVVSRIDTMFVLADPSGPLATLQVVAVYADGRREESAGISVATRFVSEALPLLSCVFFDEGTASIPERYLRRSAGEKPIAHEERRDPVLLHRDILNVVGERMRKLPDSKLTLVGTADPATEPSRCDLAKNRAAAVRDYLVDVWMIDPTRIAIAEGVPCVPQAVTESPQEEGYMENRRVEFQSSDARVLEAVWCKRTTETVGITPPIIEYDPLGSARTGVLSWAIEVYQGEQRIFADSGSGTPQLVRQMLSTREAEHLATMGLDVRYRLVDTLGRQSQIVRSVPVVRDTADVEVQRMSLILFDIAQDRVREDARVEIMSFLTGLKANDEVTITGYTDILGSDEYNRDLSERRARTVCEFIRQVVPRAHLVECYGVANKKFPAHISSYASPEERFLSRTVQLEIHRKVEGVY